MAKIDWGEITKRELKIIIEDLESELEHCRDKIIELQMEIIDEENHMERLYEQLNEAKEIQSYK